MTKSLIYFVLSLVLLIIAIVAYVFWYGHVGTLGAEAAALNAEGQAVTAQAAQISSARSALTKLAADETFFGSYFVSTSTVVSYLENLESTGHELGSAFEVVSVTPEGTDRLTVAFKAEGSFSSVMRTMGAIEYGPYDAVVPNFDLETNASSEGRWIATGTISVGMRPPQAQKPAAPAPEPEDSSL